MITLYKPRFQRGRGFGSIFKNLATKFILPSVFKKVAARGAKKAIRSIAKTAKRKAITAGLDAATSVMMGSETPKQALMTQGKKFKRDMTTKVVGVISDEKRRQQKNKSNKKKKNNKPRPSYKDIYD